MALSYKARRRWSAFVLLIGVPLYIIVAWAIVSRLNLYELPVIVEFVIYVLAGVLWVFPLKPIFRGVGKADPDDETSN
jgi:hypothetical protein